MRAVSDHRFHFQPAVVISFDSRWAAKDGMAVLSLSLSAARRKLRGLINCQSNGRGRGRGRDVTGGAWNARVGGGSVRAASLHSLRRNES